MFLNNFKRDLNLKVTLSNQKQIMYTEFNTK